MKRVAKQKRHRKIAKQKRHRSKSGHKLSEIHNPLDTLKSVKPDEPKALENEYTQKGLHKMPDNFVLYRIIGNDLYPRHKKGQARENLKFILQNEPLLENCEKRWIVNRILDQSEENQIIELLRRHKQRFIRLPFHEEEYKKVKWDIKCLPDPGYLASKEYESLNSVLRNRVTAAIYRLKNNYVMNNNGARNVALSDGKPRAKWVLPWDGNCFVTSSAWKQILKCVKASPYAKYFAVPMARVVDHALLLKDNFLPNPVSEPQLIFRTDSKEEFNENFYYGRRPKVELFWRLGIPGKWDRWKDDPWDQVRSQESEEVRQFAVAGWVARMSSGIEELEREGKKSRRGKVRIEAIISIIRDLDMIISGAGDHPNKLSLYEPEVLKEEKKRFRSGEQLPPVKQLIDNAEEVLARGPYSVTDKKSLPPSGEVNDYWHPAPYWWPNSNTDDGLPYVKRDGIRVPGTILYEPESDKYDRTRLQLVFGDSITLALAWYYTGKKKYVKHGVRILERFFINPATRMTPHLKYAQMIPGKKHTKGRGIIEMKDIYYYLDAVRLFQSAGAVSREKVNLFKEWLSTYLNWLVESEQGKQERMMRNNHGTYYDLQVAAIADFIGSGTHLFEALARAQSRIALQFAGDGSQPIELKRTITAHNCCYNFQGWIYLARIASRWGVDLWSYQPSGGAGLIKGAGWLISHAGKKWPYPQINEFDAERYLPIWFAIPKDSLEQLDADAAVFRVVSKYEVKSIFNPFDGICPYWNLGL